MRNFSTYVTCEWGLHARPCLLLATVHKHFFRQAEVFLVNLKTCEEANLTSIMSMMAAAIIPGSRVEFLTMLNEQEFHQFRAIILSLFYEKSVQGISVKTAGCYDECIRMLA